MHIAGIAHQRFSLVLTLFFKSDSLRSGQENVGHSGLKVQILQTYVSHDAARAFLNLQTFLLQALLLDLVLSLYY